MGIVVRRRCVALTAAFFLVSLLIAPVAAAQETDDRDIPLMIQTVPKVPGVQFSLNGRPFVSDANGLALITVAEPGVYEVSLESLSKESARAKFDFSVWSDGVETSTRDVEIGSFASLQAGFDTSYRTRFIDQEGHSVDPRVVDSVTLFDDEGHSRSISPVAQPWLKATRTVSEDIGLVQEDMTYLVDEVLIDGANAVPRTPQLLEGAPVGGWQIELSLHTVMLAVEDALFGPRADAVVEVRHPDGHVERHALRGGQPKAISLAPGSYHAVVDGGGISFGSGFDVDGGMSVSVTLFSWLDVVIAAALVGAIVFVAASRRSRFVPAHARGARRVPASSPTSSPVTQLAPRVEVALEDPGSEPPADPSDSVEISELQVQLDAARRDKDEIEDRLKRVLTNLLNMQDSKSQESDVRIRLESERRELLARVESERHDVATARSELRRLRDELEGARWSAVFKNDVQIERLELKSQLETYRRNSRELEVQLGRVKSQLQMERSRRKAAQEELAKRRLQLEKLLRERAAVSQQLAEAEEQLRVVQEIRMDRDDLVTKIELQDKVGEKVAASLTGALEDLIEDHAAGEATADQEAS